MTFDVSIANQSFAALGEKAFIQSQTEASTHARYANLFYDQARRAALRAFNWNFARQSKTLALLDQTSTKWLYVYALPDKCLKPRYIENPYNTSKIPYQIGLAANGESKVLMTNHPDAELVFTYDVENPALFDPLFIDVFVYSLGCRLGPTIAPGKTQEMRAKMVDAIQTAYAADAGEIVREDTYTSDWLEDRVIGSDSTVILRGET